MNELDKELSLILEKLEDLYYKTEEPEEEEKLLIFHKNMSEKLETLVRAKFDKNDKYYKRVIDRLRKVNREIRKHLETQVKIVELFRYLTNLTEQLDAVIFGWTQPVKAR
jgi:hypothetical protein